MADDLAKTSHVVHRDAFILVTGELTTGFHFYGPFDSVELAGKWAQDNLKDGTFYRTQAMHDVREGNDDDAAH